MAVIIRSACGARRNDEEVSSGSCLNLSAKTKAQGIVLNWDDPREGVDSEELGVKWGGTLVIRKEGAVPKNKEDGVLVLDNKIRGGFSVNGYLDTDVIDGAYYCYRLFPYSEKGTYDYSVQNIVRITKKGYRTMGCRINITMSADRGMVEYTDDAVGMLCESPEWDAFFNYYPCLLKNGEELGQLNTNNFAEKNDGTVADITSGNSGDVMIAFPRMGLRITTEERHIYLRMTDNPDDEAFDYYAHTRGDVRKEHFYLGAYLDVNLDGKLRSLSGLPKGSNAVAYYSIHSVREKARLNGSGYSILAFYQSLYIQAMSILKYQNFCKPIIAHDGTRSIKSGSANKVGLNHKATNEIPAYKNFGLEDIWGVVNTMEGVRNMHTRYSGMTSSDIGLYVTRDPENFSNDTMEKIGIALRGELDTFPHYVVGMYGDSQAGFIPKTFSVEKPEFLYFSTTLVPDREFMCTSEETITAINPMNGDYVFTRLMYL